jgi:micrococcal nuclease
VASPPPAGGRCDASYPDVCIPPPPPDLDCADVPYTSFRVLPPDPHRFDGRDDDGLGCES